MGVVYRATQVRLERPVALKVITPDLALDEEFRARFQRESLIAASIEHPNAIPVYEAGELDGVLYLVMRYVEGTDLRALLDREGPLEPAKAAELLAPVALALHAAHRRGLVHRDVKPANVLVAHDDEEGDHVYITDFGIARQATDTTRADVALTRTGIVVGTVDYMAPERLLGEKGDARSDVYAWGCMLYEVLAGTAPYSAVTDAAKIQAHLNQPPPSLAELRPDVPPAFDEIIQRSTAKDPADRFESAAAAAAALSEAGRAAAAASAAPSGPGETVPYKTSEPAEKPPTTVGSQAAADAGPATTAASKAPAEKPPTTVGAPAAAAGTDPGAEAAAPPAAPPAPPPAAPKKKERSGGGKRSGYLLLGLAAAAAVVLVVASLGSGGKSKSGSGGDPPQFVAARAPLFTTQVPSGWKQQDTRLAGSAFRRSEWTDPGDSATSVLVDSAPNVTSRVADRAAHTRENTSKRSGYEEHSFRAIKLGGTAAWEWRYTLPGRGEVIDYFFNQCGDGFAVQGTAPAKSFDGLADAFRTVAESLRSRSC